MEEPRFLSVDNVLHLHARTISGEGGSEGIRELALLESAVLMPQQRFGGVYLHPDLPAMAAAYLYHLCSNHPFLDGNKRIGAIAAYVFLDLNGWELRAAEDAFEELVMAVAAGEMPKESVIDWFRAHSAERLGF